MKTNLNVLFYQTTSPVAKHVQFTIVYAEKGANPHISEN